MWKNLVVVGVPFAVAITLVASCRAGERSPSEARARASVTQILFVQDRALVRNELFELFASDDQGASWHSLSAKPTALAVAEGNQLWGAHGWKGHHEAPNAKIWRSTDRGERWEQRELELPERHSEELPGRLPSLFLNDPSAPPLLLMADYQLVRPALGTDSSAWAKVGTPLPGLTSMKGSIGHQNDGLEYQGSIYVAADDRIAFSGDAGASWSAHEVAPFYKARLRCRDTTCYALLAPLGSGAATLLTTRAGSNEWQTLAVLEIDVVAAVLLAGKRDMFVESFGATDLLVTSEGVLVAGIVNAGSKPWGEVVRVDLDRAIKRHGESVPKGLWVLEQAPDGTVWAGGGDGAYRFQDGQWRATWSSSR